MAEQVLSSCDGSRVTRRVGITLAATLGVAALLVPLKADDGLYVKAKTDLTQLVRQSAWKHALAGEPVETQWPWDDTVSPTGQAVPRLGLSAAVVKSSDGSGAADQSGFLQPPRLAPSAAAQDPHLALPQVTIGDRITVTTPDGLSQAYKVTGRQIDPARSELDAAPANTDAPPDTCLSPDSTAGRLHLVIEAPHKNAEQKL